jgi:hypothetical protein
MSETDRGGNASPIPSDVRARIERWKAAGCPLDHDVRHPFSDWARTIGGILRVNGFVDFLTNYGMRRTADDPVRLGLGLLGASRRTSGCGRRTGPARPLRWGWSR